MEKKILQELSAEERLRTLQDNAVKIEIREISRNFESDELSLLKDSLSVKSISLQKLEEELKEAVDEFKDKIKPLKEEVKAIVSDIRYGYKTSSEEVYLIPDYDDNMMGIYDKNGELVATRVLAQEERQTTIMRSVQKDILNK